MKVGIASTGRMGTAILGLNGWVGSGRVSVSYGDPDHFTDAADASTDPRDVATALAHHLSTLGCVTCSLRTTYASGS